jgi:nitroimidazol reductase NimA-like FMN-containing flavoprotein (pyridoxamine 5'-phosphate oxidase superfamily)
MSWSRDEVEAFLVERPLRLGRLGTASGAGVPHVVPVWFLPDGHRLLVHTLASSRKAREIRETGRFAMSVDTDHYPYKGVALEGPAEVVGNDVLDVLGVARKLAVEHLGPEHGPAAGEGIVAMPGEHVALVLHPERWSAWDFSQG